MKGLLTGAVANNGGSASSHWVTRTPVQILEDFNKLLEAMSKPPQPMPDTIYVPLSYLYPAPVRFRVTGKRGRKRMYSAIERERQRQARGSQPSRGILQLLSENKDTNATRNQDRSQESRTQEDSNKVRTQERRTYALNISPQYSRPRHY